MKRWREAYIHLSHADKETPLIPEDLELLAMAAYLLGQSVESHDFWARAHNGYATLHNAKSSVRCAFWLGFTLLQSGESARGGGWISRARRILDEEGLHCAEEGYLLLPLALQYLAKGDAQRAFDTFEQAGRIADQFKDVDLVTLSRLGRGQTLLRLGEANKGVILLDEAMAAVDSGEISPIVSGIIYCVVIEACLEIFDLRRAQEWTEALSAWCASQPDLVPFRGQCLIRRSEIMQLHGQWTQALEEASRASALLCQPKREAAAGAANYQLAELYRLRGDFARAEHAYRECTRFGKEPQPGLSLLHLAQGKIESAKTLIQRSLQEAKGRRIRIKLLPACVEILLAAGDLNQEQQTANKLNELAQNLGAPVAHALAAYSEGAVLLAFGDAASALDKLQQAWKIWNGIEAPYECARVRLLIGRARYDIGDGENAKIEYEAARSTFDQLGAGPDIVRVNALLRNGSSAKRAGLTSRELEVLRLIARGKTNKAIAAELFISERTVERHVSNILGKLNVSSRTAAAAYAYKWQLV